VEIHNSHSFSRSFDYASGATCERFQNPLWQVSEIFLGGKFRKSVAEVKAFGSTIVSHAIQNKQSKDREPQAEPSFGNISGSLIKSLLNSIDDHQMVADAALNYLSAGKLRASYLASIAYHSRTGHHCTSTDLDILPPYAKPQQGRSYSK
jgi:hypothetical protein